ncbi:unnamed protein product [Macrosiphum euphorbiae]|uniref:C2H2-type domain-containing protein n=1 Tax=Macrosiphum euphorbiae TaxID=13131 RepID=A0AAV0VXA9_9HEMI|nr:unnamed protein product [Macrosiphum euphorbiae]
MLYTRPMPVADHFMAPWAYGDGQTDAANLGEVCETCYTHCAAGKTELWRHARDEHGADPRLSCQVPGCGRHFFAAAICADHRAHHLNGGGGGGQHADHEIAGPSDRPPLTCELCGHLSYNRSKYDRHVSAAHPEALAATCGVCHSYLGDVSSLIDHVQSVHALEICPDLSATEKTLDSGSDPKLSHRRSIRCPVCGKRYGNNRNMYAHRRVHGFADDVFPAHPQSQWSGAPTAMCSSPVHPQLCSIPVNP